MNVGPCMSPQNAFYILQGLETLGLRMEKHMSNTAALLEFLVGHEQISWVKHPSLPDHPGHDTAMRLMPKGQGSIIACGIKGGRDAGRAFIESVQFGQPFGQCRGRQNSGDPPRLDHTFTSHVRGYGLGRADR